jgi:hypothetical protein
MRACDSRVARSTLLVLLSLALALLPRAAAAQSGDEVIRKHRELHRVHDEEEQQRLTLVAKSGATKERKLVRYTLSGPADLDKTLVRFLAPRDVENTGLLTWEARDGNDDQWLYLPASRKAKRITASSKKSRFMGTDFAYEDLHGENVEVHRYTLVGTESLDGHDCFVVEAAPRTERLAADSGYSKRKLWLRKDTYLIAKREYYDKQGRLDKVEVFRRPIQVKGTAWRADEIEMHDVQNGTRTILVVERRIVDRGLTDGFFTETELTR